MEWVVSFTPRLLYPEGKRPWYPLNRRLCGPQSRSGRGGGEKNSQPPPERESSNIDKSQRFGKIAPSRPYASMYYIWNNTELQKRITEVWWQIHIYVNLSNGKVNTYLPTYLTSQSPSWKANGLSTDQQILYLSRNSKVHYHIHKSSPLVFILSQINLVHILKLYFSNIHFNIILSSAPTSPTQPLPFSFYD
jgi:hypothetical protein